MSGELFNLWLFALAIAKAVLYTGLGPGIAIAIVVEKFYVYRWNRMGRKGELCRVLVRGKRNSCLVQFQDGFQAVTSRNAIRRAR